jgi:ribosomal-protein-alanine N-acetyltransferase
MLITPATPAYLCAICSVEEECFSTPWSAETLAYEINDNNVIHFLALDNDLTHTLAGYTFMRHSYGDNFNEGHIENIAVAPAFRGRGVASLLMDALLAEAASRKITAVKLEVRQGNRAAMALYHKYGFKIEGYRRDYYHDPREDAILMCKELITGGKHP